MTLTTAQNGTFSFSADEYKINDTLDSSVDFITDENSRVKNIAKFAGEVSGTFDEVEINGKYFNSSNEVSITSDGKNITGIFGLRDGAQIEGEIAVASMEIPEGTVTINGNSYQLKDDSSVTISGGGKVIEGLDTGGVLTIGEGGLYTINGTLFKVQAGDSFSIDKDGLYRANPDDQPISEKTLAEDILDKGTSSAYIDGAGEQVIDLAETCNDLILIDNPEAAASIKSGSGSASIVVRHGATATVDVAGGSGLIIATSGTVTLENFDDNAGIQTYDYVNIASAIKSNNIKFGDGVMTLGDAQITFDDQADLTGETFAHIKNATGKNQPIAFTHSAGGTVDLRASTENYVLKGNYLNSNADTAKTGGSVLMGGAGEDIILAGQGDTLSAGSGYNRVYLTDSTLRDMNVEGATIILEDTGETVVRNFNMGYDLSADAVIVDDVSAIQFDYSSFRLAMQSGSAELVLPDPTKEDDNSYRLKLSDGKKNYNAAVAKDGSTLNVDDLDNPDIFYGKEAGINFSEYSGAVSVNLSSGLGTIGGASKQLYGINKLTGGAGKTIITGSDDKETLTAGTGNTTLRGGAGNDLLIGNTSEDKQGSTTFRFFAGDEQDTISNFDFMTDLIQIRSTKDVSQVRLYDKDVIIGINNSDSDYLTISNARGKNFKINHLIAKVDTNIEYDGFSNCYVGVGDKPTLTVGEDMGNVDIWLGGTLENHGTFYDGGIVVLDASHATGSNILAGNELDNLIIGGSGQNTFKYYEGAGNDTISGAHDGDIVDMNEIHADEVISAKITNRGIYATMQDGSQLIIQTTSAIEYKLSDATYIANYETGTWETRN